MLKFATKRLSLSVYYYFLFVCHKPVIEDTIKYNFLCSNQNRGSAPAYRFKLQQ